ncbi:MAG: FMN-binding glutamate synthase family protein [Gammaproteobacteria bacterium]|nr:FMN-binding glutamate synthase family protein [Gammaproteobacteria bacterium]
MRKHFVIASVVAVLLVWLLCLVWRPWYWLYWIVLPLIAIGVYDMFQQRHSLWRNFPLVSRGRWVMEFFRPFLRQYLFESETDGAPVNRMFRSVVYQRAKGARDTIPFGTKVDTYREGYEWIAHSISAITSEHHAVPPRVMVGGPDCTQPYSASVLNISAMSFGSLSRNAIEALNRGASKGNFAHNTGEGGVTPYHLAPGGDLIWQIGTGYFGCRTPEGKFDADTFAATSRQSQIRMIEIKLSQGAKPGHGGILPAAKNTEEIARIRGVPVHTTVDSPPRHNAFETPLELMQFVGQLRELSGGKPVGFKFCVGRTSEVIAICKAMVETGIRPDFITVDGGEGGTGAAPLEFSNSIGMPLRDGLAFVCDCLTGFGLRRDIKVIAAGKMFSAFHIVKNLSLGADIAYSARGMMMALGCVQSLICNTNHCPTGVATQDPGLTEGLVVTDKAERVARFHSETLERLMEIVSAAGLTSPEDLNRTHIHRRVNYASIQRYDEIFPYVDAGCLLQDDYPDRFRQAMLESSAESFMPVNSIARFDDGYRPLPAGA